jgi:hypothetical protein
VLRALIILSKISCSEHPPILSDGQASHEFDSNFDVDLAPKSHGRFDHHRLFSQSQDFNAPDQIGSRRVFMGIIRILRTIRTSDGEFDGTSSVEDLLKGSLPLVRSRS